MGDVAVSLPSGIALTRFDAHPERLERVSKLTGASYVLFWTPTPEGEEFHKEACFYQSTTLNLLRQSMEYVLRPSKGMVGSVFRKQQPEMIHDCRDIADGLFLRAKLAASYGLRSIAFVPFANGVLEYGTTELWDSLPSFEDGSDAL